MVFLCPPGVRRRIRNGSLRTRPALSLNGKGCKAWLGCSWQFEFLLVHLSVCSPTVFPTSHSLEVNFWAWIFLPCVHHLDPLMLPSFRCIPVHPCGSGSSAVSADLLSSVNLWALSFPMIILLFFIWFWVYYTLFYFIPIILWGLFKGKQKHLVNPTCFSHLDIIIWKALQLSFAVFCWLLK